MPSAVAVAPLMNPQLYMQDELALVREELGPLRKRRLKEAAKQKRPELNTVGSTE